MRSSYDKQSQINSLYDQLTGKEIITSYTDDDYSESGYLKALQFIAESNGKLSLETVLTFSKGDIRIQRTILQYLAQKSRGHFALIQYPELLKKCDLNAEADDEPPIAWSLAALSTSTFHSNPIFLFKHEIILHCNLDATGPDGTTVAYVLVNNPISRGYLKAVSDKVKYNLNAASKTGMTVAWLLAESEKPRSGDFYGYGDYLDGKFLTSRPELLFQCNLEANPQEPGIEDRTLGWLLAATPEGKAYFNRYPNELARCNLNVGHKDLRYYVGFQKKVDPKMWELLLLNDRSEPFYGPTLPDMVYALLHYRGIAKHEKLPYQISYSHADIISKYKLAFQYAASGNFTALLAALKNKNLLHTRTRDEGNNLLHIVLRMLDSLTSHTARMTLISLHEELFEQLDFLRTVPNRNGATPSEYIKNITLKNIFDKSKSDLDAALDYCLDITHIDLLSDIISGRYRLPVDAALQHALKILSSLPEKFPKLLRLETVTKIHLLSKTIEIKKNRLGGEKKLLPGHDLRLQRNLAEKEKIVFKNFAANLIAIIKYCETKHTQLEMQQNCLPAISKNLTKAVYSDDDKSQEPTHPEYNGIFKLAANGDYTELEATLTKNPDQLNEEKTGLDKDTLLHVILLELDKLDVLAITQIITQHPKLFTQLAQLKAAQNTLGASAADFIDSPVLKSLFGSPKSDVELLIDDLLDPTHYHLIRDVLAGLYDVQGEQFELEISRISMASLFGLTEKKSVLINADELIQRLECAFDQISSYYALYPDGFTAGTAAKINILSKEVEGIKTNVEAAKKITGLQPIKYLNKAEKVLLQDFTTNLLDIVAQYTITVHRSAEALQDLPASAVSLSLQGMFAQPAPQEQKDIQRGQQTGKRL